MKMIIEVSGGNVVNIVATEEVSIHLVDHDNLKDGDEYRQAQQPDLICDENEFKDKLEEAIEEYT